MYIYMKNPDKKTDIYIYIYIYIHMNLTGEWLFGKKSCVR